MISSRQAHNHHGQRLSFVCVKGVVRRAEVS